METLKVNSSRVLTSGDKNGKKWYLCLVTFEGKGTTEYKGFTNYELDTNKELNVELSKGEYNGKPQDEFKIISKKASDEKLVEYAIKTHIDQHFAALRADLRVIADFLKVPAPMQTVGNTNVPYPEGEVDTFTAEELTDDEIPF